MAVFFSDRVHVVSNQYILHLGEFLRIVAAMPLNHQCSRGTNVRDFRW